MTPTIEALLLAVVTILLLGGASYFRDLRPGFERWAGPPMLTGAAAGALVQVSERLRGPSTELVAVGLSSTLAALYLGHRDDDALDSFADGAVAGIAAALLLIAAGAAPLEPLQRFPLTLAVSAAVVARLTGATAGKRAVAAGAGLLTAFACAMLPMAASAAGVPDGVVTSTALLALPATIVISVFVRWKVVRTELEDEAALGFFRAGEVAATAHPLRRLRKNGWPEWESRRAFLRTARQLAMRKRRQRGMALDAARLHQLEILKLRMELQRIDEVRMNMNASIGRDRAEGAGAAASSDTMISKGEQNSG